MTGIDVYRQVSSLLGIDPSSETGSSDKVLLSNVLSTTNRVLADLTDYKTSITKLSDEITLSDTVLESIPYGVAMFLLLQRGDRERYNIFADLDSKKRARAKNVITRIKQSNGI